MKKTWYIMCIGYDCGGPEDGPIIHTDKIPLKAKSLEKAKERARQIIERQYQNECEGHSVREAEDSEIAEIIEYCTELKEMLEFEKNYIFDNGNVYTREEYNVI